MKNYRIFFLPFSFLFLLLLVGCPPSGGGGGDDDDDHGTAPRITDVDFYKCTNEDPDTCNDQQSYFYVGDYYNRWIECVDPDLDVKYMHYTWYKRVNGQYTISDGPDVKEMPTQTKETYYYRWVSNHLINGPKNSYKIEYQLEDTKNNMGNTFTVFLEVKE